MGKRKFNERDLVTPTNLAPSYLKHKKGVLEVIAYNSNNMKYEIFCHCDGSVVHVLSGAIKHDNPTDESIKYLDSDPMDIASDVQKFIDDRINEAKDIESSISDELAAIKDINIAISITKEINKIPNRQVLELMNFMIIKNPSLGHKPVVELYHLAEDVCNKVNLL